MTSTAPGYLLGVDLGTSGCKAVAVGVDGALLATAEVRYPTTAPRPGWAEQDPGDWWEAACTSIRRLRGGLPPGAQPLGIGATGQMHTLVTLDRALAVIRPAILWSDRRSQEQAESIGRIVGEQVLLDITRNPSRAAFTASKLAWLKDHEPPSAARVRHVLLPKDWLVLRLTGELVTEPSDASGTGWFDVAGQHWSAELNDVVTRAAGSPPGARGARFVPLLMGSRDPGQTGGDTGAFLGLREDHTADDLARAVLEGIAFEVGRVARTLHTPLPAAPVRDRQVAPSDTTDYTPYLAAYEAYRDAGAEAVRPGGW